MNAEEAMAFEVLFLGSCLKLPTNHTIADILVQRLLRKHSRKHLFPSVLFFLPLRPLIYQVSHIQQTHDILIQWRRTRLPNLHFVLSHSFLLLLFPSSSVTLTTLPSFRLLILLISFPPSLIALLIDNSNNCSLNSCNSQRRRECFNLHIFAEFGEALCAAV